MMEKLLSTSSTGSITLKHQLWMEGAEEPRFSGINWAHFIAKMFLSMRKRIQTSQYQVLSIPSFILIVENTLSGDYIMINIRSLFKPSTNEIWIKNAATDVQQEKFWLI
jgi:hypothetical protein